MPYDVDSPLGVGLGAAAGVMQGQAQAKQTALDQQTQALQNAYLQSQTNEKNIKAQQMQSVLPYLAPELQAKVSLMLAQGNLDGATALLRGAQTGLVKAQTTEILQGKLPLDKAHAAYYNSLPAYNQAKLQEMQSSVNERYWATGQQIASRIQIAGADNDTKLILGMMTAQRMDFTGNEKIAFQEAQDTYNAEYKAYIQNQQDLAKGTGGDPTMKEPHFTFDINSNNRGGGDTGGIDPHTLALAQWMMTHPGQPLPTAAVTTSAAPHKVTPVSTVGGAADVSADDPRVQAGVSAMQKLPRSQWPKILRESSAPPDVKKAIIKALYGGATPTLGGASGAF